MACLPNYQNSKCCVEQEHGDGVGGGKVPGAERTSGVTQANGINREA